MRREADRVEGIDAACRANWQRIAPHVGRQIRGGEEGAWRLLVFQGPLLLGAINQPEIIDAGRSHGLLGIGCRETITRGQGALGGGVGLPRGCRMKRVGTQGLDLSLSALRLAPGPSGVGW